MNKVAFSAAMALKEHFLQGHKVSLLEALLIFGVQNLNAELRKKKKDGFIVKSQRVPMAKIIRRINEYTVCNPPKNLPTREILMTEYWISE